MAQLTGAAALDASGQDASGREATGLEATGLEATPAEAAVAPQRLLLIMVDTLRRDHLGAYGYDRPTSPTIDRLARHGVLFEDVRSTSSWTKPAIASLFTGVGPLVHGVEKGSLPELRRGEVDALAQGWQTLPEVFRAHGFATIGFCANPHVAERTGLAQGFDRLLWGRQRGEHLAVKLLNWLETPYDLGAPALRRYARSPRNLLAGWHRRPIQAPDGVRVERQNGTLILSREDDSNARKTIELSLGDLEPEASGRWVLALRARHPERTALTVWAGSGADRRSVLQLQRSWVTDTTIDHVLLDLASDRPEALTLEVALSSGSSRLELLDLVLMPEAEIERAQRWLAYVHFMQAHLPYPATDEHMRLFPPRGGKPTPLTPRAIRSLGRQQVRGAQSLEDYEARYDATIHEVDSYIKLIIERLAALELLAGTLIVVTSDHGEELMDHGAMNHAHSLYDELVRIPLIFSQAGRWPEGVRVAAPASIIDLYPTLVDLMGWTVPDQPTGRSLLPAMVGNRVAEVPTLMTHTAMSNQRLDRLDALVDGRWKLIHDRATGGSTPFELYDLIEDPDEQYDLAASHPDVVARLASRLDELRQAEATLATELGHEATPVELSAEAEAELRSLGYVD
ncbi:MAG: sulfatase-like hydrolase/transferase [Acidobacteriota bacterium]